MKYIPLVITIVTLIIVYASVSISDKYIVIAHKLSQEKVTEIRHNIFSGKKETNTKH